MDCQFIRDDADAAKPFRCEFCDYRWKTDQLHRNCPHRSLSNTGRTLAEMKPGDGLAWVAEHLGIHKVIDPETCGCVDRQAWMNNQWLRWVQRTFSEPTKPTAHPT
jgi:hypothetical protein